MRFLQHWFWFILGAGLTGGLYFPFQTLLEPWFLDPATPDVLARQLPEFAVVASGFSALLLSMAVYGVSSHIRKTGS